MYTPSRFEDEIRGLADGSGIDVDGIRRINLVPELIRAACTIMGVWGPATPGGSLL